MLTHLLDTNIVIYVVKRRPIEALASFNRHYGRLAVSAITLAELVHGADKSSDPARNLSVVEDFCSRLSVLPYGEREAYHYGSIRAAVELARSRGYKVAQAHLRHLNPLPKNTEAVLKSFKKVICPEMNLGQLATVLRAKTLVDVQTVSKVKGKAFTVAEIFAAIQAKQ